MQYVAWREQLLAPADSGHVNLGLFTVVLREANECTWSRDKTDSIIVDKIGGDICVARSYSTFDATFSLR